ncbi:kinase suppressor of Ras 2 [Pleurotus pulmonarius]|nr:kinase suppressor of Ras 2 [Pleurotus pulmonarius]
MTIVSPPPASVQAASLIEQDCQWLVCVRDLSEEAESNSPAKKTITSSGDAVRVKRVVFSSKSQRRRQVKEFAQRLNEWHAIAGRELLLPILAFGLDESPAAISLISPWVGRGQTIMEYIKENPAHDRLSSAREVAEAINYLHDTKKGWNTPAFVHGDIRGDNIFVRPGGSCYLGEFALTCAEPIQEDPSMPATFRHTRWMAPERLNPKAFSSYPTDDGSYADGKLRTCNDIYSLASTIFEILTGDVPYYQYHHDAFVMADALRGVLPEPQDLDKARLSGLTDDIQTLLNRMWSYSPSERLHADTVCRILKTPSSVNKRRPQRLAPVFAATAAAAARRLYL